MAKKKRNSFNKRVIVDCGENEELEESIKNRLIAECKASHDKPSWMLAVSPTSEVVIVKGFGDQTGEVANMLRSSLRTLKRKYNLQQKQAGGKR